ncbi:hypothetical protein PGUG_04437 [Meyerozyma guilliermondii ATCC 6260]|uniref:Zn(2)-C6 fungal-type domain-containing protein n=1 Tax=Meyerozyma guilliermondii (strain ATCC 6260 / CBS 566 / DSM 6381 / JCM 1539 / NBRC 10279 / NRRL Y-324) TaxID=294746 RepID=A5DMD6_PICGU|nr:uncharacterized protein PGUG_04437 [Meyerozyma guilliermondii ATCC 6260]EDK40339.2 hypothetical protein PGUG_04437 [Meyerozyma guilliermondii ATCC 6260]
MPNYGVSHHQDHKLQPYSPKQNHPYQYTDRAGPHIHDFNAGYSPPFMPISPTSNLPVDFFIPNQNPINHNQNHQDPLNHHLPDHQNSPLGVRHAMISHGLPDPTPQWDPSDSFFPDVPDTHDFYSLADLPNPSLESINELSPSYDQFFPPPPIRTDFIAPFTPSFSDGVSDYSDTSESSRYGQRTKSSSSISVSPSTSKITKKPSFSKKPSLQRLPKSADSMMSPLINNYVNLDLNASVRSDSSVSSRSEDHSISRKSSKLSLNEAAAAAVKTPKKHTRRKLNPRSRNGCWICRIKHVKCDEERPVCNGCKKYNLECDYSPDKPAYVTDKNLRQEKLQQIARPRNKSGSDKGRRVS